MFPKHYRERIALLDSNLFVESVIDLTLNVPVWQLEDVVVFDIFSLNL